MKFSKLCFDSFLIFITHEVIEGLGVMQIRERTFTSFFSELTDVVDAYVGVEAACDKNRENILLNGMNFIWIQILFKA